MQKKNPITTLSETASRSLLENRVIVEHTHKVFLVLQIHRICLLTKPSRWKCASSENHMQFTSTLLRSSISCKSFTNCFLFSMNAVWSGFYVWNLYVNKVRHFLTVIWCRRFAQKIGDCSFPDWFSRRASKCLLNDRYICFCNNQSLSSYTVFFSSVTLPVSWNLSNNALIVFGCGSLATWLFDWKLRLVTITPCPDRRNSNTGIIL